jgi:hypothetical protein
MPAEQKNDLHGEAPVYGNDDRHGSGKVPGTHFDRGRPDGVALGMAARVRSGKYRGPRCTRLPRCPIPEMGPNRPGPPNFRGKGGL